MDNKKNNSIFKRIMAISGIVLILVLYIVTFILAIMNNSLTNKFFNAALFSTVFVPVFIYVVLWLAKVLKDDPSKAKKEASDKESDTSN